MPDHTEWLRGLAEKGGKGVVNNIDARSLGRVADEICTLRLALTNILALCTELGDFKNGVTHQGIDEGEVYASGVFDQAYAALNGAVGTGKQP